MDDDELSSRGDMHVTDRNDVMFWRALEVRIGREAVLRFRDTHWIFAKSGVLQLLESVSNGFVCNYLVGAIDALSDESNLVPQRFAVGVQ